MTRFLIRLSYNPTITRIRCLTFQLFALIGLCFTASATIWMIVLH